MHASLQSRTNGELCTSRYLLGSDDAEIERLMAQTVAFERDVHWLFGELERVPGGRAIDLGCGVLGVIPHLASHVGPRGQVIGLDMDPTMLEHAAAHCRARGVTNARFVHGDITATGLPDASFDLVHIRLVLVNIANPEEALAEAVRLVRPGGVLAVQEFDIDCWRPDPECPEWTELKQLLVRLWDSRGFDCRIGRRLRRLLLDAGLNDVQAMAHTTLDGQHDPYRSTVVDLARRFGPQLVELGFTDSAQLDKLLQAAGSFLSPSSPATFGNSIWRPLMCQAWGTRGAPQRA